LPFIAVRQVFFAAMATKIAVRIGLGAAKIEYGGTAIELFAAAIGYVAVLRQYLAATVV
jgi:hypothetical protein